MVLIILPLINIISNVQNTIIFHPKYPLATKSPNIFHFYLIMPHIDTSKCFPVFLFLLKSNFILNTLDGRTLKSMLNSAFGVDFGNQNFLVSMQKNGSIDVVLNESSKRLTPTMISVDNDRRYAGEAAMSQYMMNLTGTITNMKRLVGLKYQSLERENIEKLVPYRLIELENGLAGVLINYKNDSHIFRIEQIISMLFNNVLQIARENNSLDDEFVTVVSPWWNEEQRRIIIDAAKICGCSQVRLLNSTTAAAIAYLFYHKEKLPSEQDPPIYSAIVDFGDSSLNVSITEMKNGYLRVESISCDNTVGGSDFTQALAKYIINTILQKYRIDPRSNPKAMIRLYSAVEKLKKGLTVNPVMSFEVQSLMNDIDVSFLVKREEFEDQIQNLIEKIRPPVESAIEKGLKLFLPESQKIDGFQPRNHGFCFENFMKNIMPSYSTTLSQ